VKKTENFITVSAPATSVKLGHGHCLTGKTPNAGLGETLMQNEIALIMKAMECSEHYAEWIMKVLKHDNDIPDWNADEKTLYAHLNQAISRAESREEWRKNPTWTWK
jgi:hypothetical protein